MKPESRYIGLIHKRLPTVYCEKNNNPYRSGTPDVWYSGDLGDLWIEYKYIPKIPTRSLTVPDLSDRQKRWLGNRLDEGRNLAVVLGTPKGGVIYRDRAWLLPLTPVELCDQIVSNDEVANWIRSQTGVHQCLTIE